MNWREEQVFNIVRYEERLKTVDIIEKAGMSKATVLKYLNCLKTSGLINYEMIGPVKLWFAVNGKKNHKKKPIRWDSEEISTLLRKFEVLTGKKTIALITVDNMLRIIK